MAYFSAGIGCGWISPILNRFKNSKSDDFSLTSEACSWIASIHYASRGVGCILMALLVDRIGRNQAFVLSAISGFVIWIGVFTSKSIPVHYVMRLIFGLGIGMFETTAPLYIGENSSPNFRGIFGGLCIIAFYTGELLEFWVAAYFSYSTIAVFNATLTLLITTSMLLLREPAQHLLAKGKEELAEERFFELRGVNPTTRREFEETKQYFARPKPKLTLKLLADKSVRSVSIVNCLVYLTGYPPINAMSSLILSSSTHLSPNELTILLGFIQLLAVCLSSTIVERFGRRPLLLISALVSFASHLIVAAVFVFEDRGTPLPHSGWITFVFVTAYSVIVAAIFFPISTTIRGELLSPELKPIGGCLAIIMNSVVSVVITGVFLGIAEAYGRHTNFLFYAAMSATMFFYVYFDLPETKGLTLTEIQRSLQKYN